jgi:uncharacterized protein
MKYALAIMARYPVAGKVKTRLAQSIGVGEAMEFYGRCASQIFWEMANLPACISRYVFFTGTKDTGRVQSWVEPVGYRLIEQRGRNLGIRLSNAFDELFAENISRAVIIASDVPDISASLVSRSLEALKKNDIVLGPSHDGGYYLIGMSASHPELFRRIKWGSDQVLRTTKRKIVDSGLSCHLLPALIDIDSIDDYNSWRLTLNGDSVVRPAGKAIAMRRKRSRTANRGLCDD